MMFNCSRKLQNGSEKSSKSTDEEIIDQNGLLQDVVTVLQSGSITGQSESLPSATFGPCYLCPTIGNHRAEVKRIVENGIGPKIETSVRDIPLCTIKTPTGEKSMTLDDIEKMYTKNFPTWDREFQCFPEGPIFYDKLFKIEPFTRAIDIEERVNQLKSKIKHISKVPFDVELDSDDVIISKTVHYVLESLQDLIKHLSLDNNSRVKKTLPTILSGMVRGKLTQLKEASHSIASIHEIQYTIFGKVLENDNKCREERGYYAMR